MSKPISDRWIAARIAEIQESEMYHDRMAVKALRELQRYRKAIREHQEKQNAVDKWNAHDRTLYRATLPEGEK